MRLLIDHDILLYRALFGCKLGYYRQLQTCEALVDKVLERFSYPDFTLVMTGSGNFRYQVDPLYKANRKDTPKPFYLYDAKNYFQKYWGAVLSEGCEADDVIGMAHDDETIVVSSDKDFYQLGGLIYNPIKDEAVNVENPWYFFYKQMLTGDAADNIPGVSNPAKSHHKSPPNFTDATAMDLLRDKSQEECKAIVQEMYQLSFYNGWHEQFDTNAKLLFLKRPYAQEYNQIF